MCVVGRISKGFGATARGRDHAVWVVWLIDTEIKYVESNQEQHCMLLLFLYRYPLRWKIIPYTHVYGQAVADFGSLSVATV